MDFTAPAAPIFEFSKAAANAPVKPKPEFVSFLQHFGYQQYAVPLACAGFASMPELSLHQKVWCFGWPHTEGLGVHCVHA